MTSVETMTLDEICEEINIPLKNRTKILGRMKANYPHGIVRLVEHGRAGKLKKAECDMKKSVAKEFIRMTDQKAKKNKRLLNSHGWLYFLKLKSMVRNSDGTYSVWVKVGETVEFLNRLKQYKGTTEVAEVLCNLPVHNRKASEDNALEFLESKKLIRGRREYFLVPEGRLAEITEEFFKNHIMFTGNYALQAGGTRKPCKTPYGKTESALRPFAPLDSPG